MALGLTQGGSAGSPLTISRLERDGWAFMTKWGEATLPLALQKENQVAQHLQRCSPPSTALHRKITSRGCLAIISNPLIGDQRWMLT